MMTDSILLGIFTVLLLTIIIKFIIWWRKNRKIEIWELHHEQKYPLAFVGSCSDYPRKRKIGWNASMIINKFTDQFGDTIDTSNYLGFLVFGTGYENTDYNIKHGDLIFVKSDIDVTDIRLPKLVIAKQTTKGHYVIRECVKVTKEKVKLKNIVSQKISTVDIKKIIGTVDYDFTI